MEFLFDLIEAIFSAFYLKIGKVLFGEKFLTQPKSFSRGKRVVTGTLTMITSIGIAIALWFGVAFILT